MDSSSSRVKAFRERLAEDNYRRVEGYVSSDEKLQIDQIRREQATTADVAVAGLLRLGLAAYRAQSLLNGASASAAAPGASAAVSFLGESSNSLITSSRASAATQLAPFPAQPQPNPIAQFFQRRKEITNAST